MNNVMKFLIAPLLLAVSSSLAPAFADNDDRMDKNGAYSETGRAEHKARYGDKSKQHKDIKELLRDSKKVIQAMKKDEGMSGLMDKAKGLYVLPNYGRGAFVVGGRGGEGVLLTSRGGKVVNPAFYNLGAISVGAQAGGEAGEVVMLLMTDKAVNSFKQDNNFSINADAGLTVLDWSAQAQENIGKGDAVIWSSTEGAFAGGAISVSNIAVDEEANRAYYGEKVPVRDILEGKASKSHGKKQDTGKQY